MMEPPTDNLYKFLAIFGLVLVGMSIYVPLQRLEAFSRGSMRVEIAYGPLIDQLKVLDDSARDDLKCFIREAQKKESGQVSDPSACESARAKEEATTIATEKASELRAKAEELSAERNFLFEQYRRFLFLGIGVGCLGLCLCVAGFWLWYNRLQRHLDAAVKREATSTGRDKR